MSEFDQFSGVFEQVKELDFVKFWEHPTVLGGLSACSVADRLAPESFGVIRG